MGISFTKMFGTRKLNKKLFGKRDRGSWGYFRKKVGLRNPFKSKVVPNSASSLSDIYGPTGSIVGRY